MIHNKVTARNMPPFLDELRELMRKYNFAAISGIILSAGTGTSFKIIADQVLMGTDKDRVDAAAAMIDQVSVKIGGSLQML